jgi:hypothetical protein
MLIAQLASPQEAARQRPMTVDDLFTLSGVMRKHAGHTTRALR